MQNIQRKLKIIHTYMPHTFILIHVHVCKHASLKIIKQIICEQYTLKTCNDRIGAFKRCFWTLHHDMN